MTKHWLPGGIFLLLTLALEKARCDTPSPVTVYGQESMTCLEEKNMCIAVGQAWAKKQDLLVSGDKLCVHFKKVQGKRVITAFEAVGHVKVNHPSGIIVGEHLWYTTATQTLTVRGQLVVLRTQRYLLTAKEKLEYCHQTNRAYAVGSAEFKQGPSTITSDCIEAQFHSSTPPSGPLEKKALSASPKTESLTLEWAKTKGHVHIWQKNQRASGDRSFYDAMTEKVYLWGQVSLSQGKDFAKGDEGVFDLKNKKATLVGDKRPVYFLLNPQNLKHHSGKKL
jgi:lipopolysaccharide export system protein LptA